MSDYMLRTDNYAAMEAALFAVGLVVDGTDMYGVLRSFQYQGSPLTT